MSDTWTSKFMSWMEAVDKYLFEEMGVTHQSFPDIDYWALYQQGLTPRQAGDAALKNARGEE